MEQQFFSFALLRFATANPIFVLAVIVVCLLVSFPDSSKWKFQVLCCKQVANKFTSRLKPGFYWL